MVLKGVLPFFDKKLNLTSDLGIRANGRNVAGREVPFSPFLMGKNFDGDSSTLIKFGTGRNLITCIYVQREPSREALQT